MAKGKKTGGRRPGSPNKVTVVARAAFQMAAEGIGGVPHLIAWAKKNPTEFYKLYARLIPTEVVGDPNAPVQMKVIFGGRYKPEDKGA